jgi:hypothetical protein
MIIRTTASTLKQIFFRRGSTWTTIWKGVIPPPSRPHYLSLDLPLLTPQAGTPSTDKKEPTKPKDPLTLRLDALDAKYKKEATQVSGTLKNINEKFEKQEVRVKVVERVKNDLSSLMARMVSVEKGVSDKKTAGSQATMNSEMITQALNRIKVLEDKEKATTGGKDAHPVTKLLLGYRSRWKEMGFENVGRLEKFANDVRPPYLAHVEAPAVTDGRQLPKALSYIAPEPEIAMHATAGKIVDIFEHLPGEDKVVLQRVFPVIFGRPVDDWKNASAEEKARSIADVAYAFVWKLACTTDVEETVLVRRVMKGKP